MLYKQQPSPVANQATFDLFIRLMNAGHNPGASRGEAHCAALAKAIREHAPHLGDDAIDGAFVFAMVAKHSPSIVDKLMDGTPT